MNTKLAKLDWCTHLNDWKRYLQVIIDDNACKEDIPSKIKYKRQLAALIEVTYGIVTNPDIFVHMIKPEAIAQMPKIDMDNINWYQKLDMAQQRAVAAVLTNQPLILIQGPPGTGKTTVITESVLQTLESNPVARILIASESHVAVDNVLEKLLKLRPELDVIRISNNPDKIGDHPDIQSIAANVRMDEYYNWLETHEAVPAGLATALKGIFTVKGAPIKIYRDLANSAQIVVATCNLVAAWSYSNQDAPFDLVVVDEVCKATLPEVIAPLKLGQRALLVGDPIQLPPVFCMEEIELQKNEKLELISERQYINELFEQMKHTGHVHFLNQQYRMPNQLGSFISNAFYRGKLSNGLDRDKPDSLYWIDSSNKILVPPNEKKNQLSNPHEVDIVVKIVDHVLTLRKNNQCFSMAIVTPYKEQMRALKNAIKGKVPSSVSVQIDTVDAFQGRDADVVIFSATRNYGSLRFLGDRKRMNVALSRAKSELWFVGCKSFLRKVPFLVQLEQMAQPFILDIATHSEI